DARRGDLVAVRAEGCRRVARVRSRARVRAHRDPGSEHRARAERRAGHGSPARWSGRVEHGARDRTAAADDHRSGTARIRDRWIAASGRPIAAGERAIENEELPHELIRFAHNSERQFAKLLDFYSIVWEYEPRTFILENDRDGRPVQAFTPDFYLPAYDLYI